MKSTIIKFHFILSNRALSITQGKVLLYVSPITTLLRNTLILIVTISLKQYLLGGNFSVFSTTLTQWALFETAWKFSCILTLNTFSCTELLWNSAGACSHCNPNLVDKGLVLNQLTFVLSQSQYALDIGTDHGCFSLLLAYETLYCFDLSTATALLLCGILLFLLYTPILVTQSPLKNLPSRALRVSFIV